MEKPTGSQKSSAMGTTPSSKFAVSVDLASYMKVGILLCVFGSPVMKLKKDHNQTRP